MSAPYGAVSSSLSLVTTRAMVGASGAWSLPVRVGRCTGELGAVKNRVQVRVPAPQITPLETMHRLGKFSLLLEP